MKTKILFLLLLNGFSGKTQFISCDYINLGEDQSSHNFLSYGQVNIGAYQCGNDQTIRIGNGSSGDSATFDMAVLPGTDTIMFEAQVPWSGGPNSSLTIDHVRHTFVPGNSSCDTMFVSLTGVSVLTGDGNLHITLSDSLNGFAMDCQITYLRLWCYQAPTGQKGLPVRKSDATFQFFPNPASDESVCVARVFLPGIPLIISDLQGRMVQIYYIDNSRYTIDISMLENGIYLASYGDQTSRLVIQH